VIAIFLDRMREGAPTEIFGDGSQTRDFVFVGDVVEAVLAAEAHDGGVFNVGTGVETSIMDLHGLCRRVTGVDRKPELRPARAGDVLRSVIDPSLAARELGWRPRHDLEEGLRKTWAS
jgi:UDP-glucose 4-epimerase